VRVVARDAPHPRRVFGRLPGAAVESALG
jgi:hypothetical protein